MNTYDKKFPMMSVFLNHENKPISKFFFNHENKPISRIPFNRLTTCFCDFLRRLSFDAWWLRKHHHWHVSAFYTVLVQVHQESSWGHLSVVHIQNCPQDPPCPLCWTERIWTMPSHRKTENTTPEMHTI